MNCKHFQLINYLLKKRPVSGVACVSHKLVQPVRRCSHDEVFLWFGYRVILKVCDWNMLTPAQVKNLLPVLFEWSSEEPLFARIEICLKNQTTGRPHQDRAGDWLTLVRLAPANSRDQVTADLCRHFGLLAFPGKVKQVWQHRLIWNRDGVSVCIKNAKSETENYFYIFKGSMN